MAETIATGDPKPSSGPNTPRRRPPLFSRMTIIFYAVAALAMALVFVYRGPEVLREALWHSGEMLLFISPMIVAGLFLGSLFRTMANPAVIAPILGKESGWKGLCLATLLGTVTPGGPYTAFPIVYALYVSGADTGATIAYLTAWCMMGVQRLWIWELPFLGGDFVLVRLLITAPLIVLAGALARYLAAGPLRRIEATATRKKEEAGQ